ncbi:helix-turn-helix domain-containing protein [Streptomyces geranii]|uniref:helix-turn-helix domain-containing protein n=1 Tax=Streptomyces geranii TaxID=2058923 RepID=UPI000D02E291|nr:helix-turn-helix transcriptional regulator [Streptomyces geranii]
MTGDEFPELLGRLKERSGLSYGSLGKRLHMSASTLHRYVNGDAVPTDYAPVERFARLCRATPEELVELHRRWILADAMRGQPKSTPTAPAAPTAPAVPATQAAPDAPAVPATPAAPAAPPEESVPPARRRRTVVLAGAAVVAAAVAAALVVNLVPGEGADDRSGQRPVGAVASGSPGAGPAASAVPTASKSGSATPSASPSSSSTVSSSPGVSASRSAAAGVAQGGAGVEDGATAPTVTVNPYKWEDPCGPHVLIDREPDQVPPPPNEPDARGWLTALGGVTAGQQLVALTVQGTGQATVVLEDLHVRVVARNEPLAWNDYQMHDGCGGGVDTKAFDVDLDDGRPLVAPRSGQRGFPYKVSESDPEVFYVFADARAYDVGWYLELEWSSGKRHGILRVDDNGSPFRTSGNGGRPSYIHRNGSSEWTRDEYAPNIPG